MCGKRQTVNANSKKLSCKYCGIQFSLSPVTDKKQDKSEDSFSFSDSCVVVGAFGILAAAAVITVSSVVDKTIDFLAKTLNIENGEDNDSNSDYLDNYLYSDQYFNFDDEDDY